MTEPRNKARYYVATFGCRVNQADSEAILGTLRAKDLEPALDHREADLVVINSCTVTHRSDSDLRKLVSRVERDNPAARIVVTGCYAQRDPHALVRLRGVRAVVGNSETIRLGQVIDQILDADRQGEPLVLWSSMHGREVEEVPPVTPVAMVHGRTRPFVKIQDGCDACCTYCVIPSVRGPARSAHPDRVLETVRRLVRDGFFEIVLTGVHLGAYGQSSPPACGDLDGVVRRILDEIPDLGRLRLSCIEPMAFPLGLADLARDQPRLAPHFHLPLQSGADRVLRRMGRPYRAADLEALIHEIRVRVPEACLGTDAIVGFPGETEEDFESTCRVVERAGFDNVHVFSYSDRAGVPSTRLREKVDPRLVKARATALNRIAERQWNRFLERQVGRELDAVTLDASADGSTNALASNYAPIVCTGAAFPANMPVRVKIASRDAERVYGVPNQLTDQYWA